MQDARNVARASMMAASVLHKAGIVHTDFRVENFVWLDDEHCMVIDLETCRSASDPLPPDCTFLRDWDNSTLELGEGGKLFFTPASDLYQVGRMLQKLLKAVWSQAARSFVDMLLRSRQGQGHQGLDADEALKHEWFAQL